VQKKIDLAVRDNIRPGEFKNRQKRKASLGQASGKGFQFESYVLILVAYPGYHQDNIADSL